MDNTTLIVVTVGANAHWLIKLAYFVFRRWTQYLTAKVRRMPRRELHVRLNLDITFGRPTRRTLCVERPLNGIDGE